MKGSKMSHVNDVENFFKKYPNKTHELGELCRRLRMKPYQVRNSLSYLRHKADNNIRFIDIQVVKRGREWRYVPHPDTPDEPQVVAPITEQERRNRATNRALAAHRVMADQHGGIEEATRKSAEGALHIVPTGPVPDWAQAVEDVSDGWYREIGKAHDGCALVKNNTGKVFRVVPV
jgi:hypothetical protein